MEAILPSWHTWARTICWAGSRQAMSSGLGAPAPRRLMTWRQIVVADTSVWPSRFWTDQPSREGNGETDGKAGGRGSGEATESKVDAAFEKVGGDPGLGPSQVMGFCVGRNIAGIQQLFVGRMRIRGGWLRVEFGHGWCVGSVDFLGRVPGGRWSDSWGKAARSAAVQGGLRPRRERSNENRPRCWNAAGLNSALGEGAAQVRPSG
jgi:hypothetical protein